MPQSKRFALVAGLVAFASATVSSPWLASRALACSQPCPMIVELPVKGPYFSNPTNVYPANAAAFRLDTGTSAEHLSSYHVTLREGITGGVPISGSLRVMPSGERLFVPDAPLTPFATYVLSFDPLCGPSYPLPDRDGVPRTGELVFRAGEARPLPTTMGPLRVETEGFDYAINPKATKSAFVSLRFGGGDGDAFQSVTEFKVEVDGEVYAYRRLGEERKFTITAPCDHVAGGTQSSCGGFVDTVPGRHTVKVIPHVLGAAVDPAPLSIDIDLVCGANAGTNRAGLGPTDAGVSDAEVSPRDGSAAATETQSSADGLTTGTPDAGASFGSDLGDDRRPAPNSGGCSLGGTVRGGGAGSLLCGLALLAVKLGRRARRQARSA